MSEVAKFDDLTRLLDFFVSRGLPGCGCAVAQRGKILYEAYVGHGDIKSKKPVTSDTVFRLYSMTKLVTCTAALKLFEQGKFLLHEPLYEYFPEYRDSQVVIKEPDGSYHLKKVENPILIKHAFSMSLGLPYAMFSDTPTAKAMKKVTDDLQKKYGKYDIVTEVKAMGQVPLEFEPGTRWMYGYGHDILAALIQLVSGKTPGQFMQEEIFDPLGMKDTGYRYKDDIKDRMITYYQKNPDGSLTKTEGPMRLDVYHEPDAIYEAGGVGLYSTIRDYLRFTQMLANGGHWNGEQIIGRKTIDLMRSNQLNDLQLRDFTNSYNAGYGYGLGVRTMLNTTQGHSNGSVGAFGWTGLAGTYTEIDPSEGVSIVYMHQMDPNFEEYHHLRVRNVAYGCLK